MKEPKVIPAFRFEEEFMEEAVLDVYSDDLDDEELIDRGMQGWEAALIRGEKHARDNN